MKNRPPRIWRNKNGRKYVILNGKKIYIKQHGLNDNQLVKVIINTMVKRSKNGKREKQQKRNKGLPGLFPTGSGFIGVPTRDESHRDLVNLISNIISKRLELPGVALPAIGAPPIPPALAARPIPPLIGEEEEPIEEVVRKRFPLIKVKHPVTGQEYDVPVDQAEKLLNMGINAYHIRDNEYAQLRGHLDQRERDFAEEAEKREQHRREQLARLEAERNKLRAQADADREAQNKVNQARVEREVNDKKAIMDGRILWRLAKVYDNDRFRNQTTKEVAWKYLREHLPDVFSDQAILRMPATKSKMKKFLEDLIKKPPVIVSQPAQAEPVAQAEPESSPFTSPVRKTSSLEELNEAIKLIAQNIDPSAAKLIYQKLIGESGEGLSPELMIKNLVARGKISMKEIISISEQADIQYALGELASKLSKPKFVSLEDEPEEALPFQASDIQPPSFQLPSSPAKPEDTPITSRYKKRVEENKMKRKKQLEQIPWKELQAEGAKVKAGRWASKEDIISKLLDRIDQGEDNGGDQDIDSGDEEYQRQEREADDDETALARANELLREEEEVAQQLSARGSPQKQGNGLEKRKGGLYDDEIDKILDKYRNKGYMGCVSIDEVGDINPHGKKKIAIVINESPSYRPGSHWIGLWIDASDDKEVDYYDSYAEEPPERLLKEIKRLIDKMHPDTYLKFKINKVRQQRTTSNNCGWFALRFLMDRMNGIPFKDCSGWSEATKGEKAIEKFKEKFTYI